MGLFQVACMSLMAAVARSQELQNCSVDISLFTVSSTEDAATLATSLACSNGDFAVQWVEEVFVNQTIHVTHGTSLNINGAGPGAIADGHGIQQLFVVDAGSRLHLSNMTLAHGNASGPVFSSGGAIFSSQSSISFSGHMSFTSNSANENGGAIYALDSTIWGGNGTHFISNSAGLDGGAVCASYNSTMYWNGDGTQFSSNSADRNGGAIYAIESTVSWDGHTTFSSNVAGKNGGVLASVDLGMRDVRKDVAYFSGATLVNNSACYGGALYFSNSEYGFNLADLTFQDNSASVAGGAVVAYETGTEFNPVTFSRCTFSNNVASGSGGAVDTFSGKHEFLSCHFEDNSADIGGALRLGGSADIVNCSFLSNFAYTRGLAVAVVESANINGSSFVGNQLSCANGSYRSDTEKEDPDARFETVCLDCPDWDECSGCTIERGNVAPMCEAPLWHTSADNDGVTLETLHIDRGYWRATNESDNILACFNADACNGGQTGAHSFCASGYQGPYCAVCEIGYSPSLYHTCTRCSSSRSRRLLAATVIAVLVALCAVVAILRYMMSTELEDRDAGRFHRRVLGAVPVQALKIIVVVWQILTQFADAANVTYPGVYQDFLSAIGIVNFDLGSVVAAWCLWYGVDFYDRLLISTMGPIVVCGVLATTHWIAMRRNSTVGYAGIQKIHHKHLTALLLLMFLVYSSVSSIVFQTFACETLDDGVEYLRADYRIRCTGAKHEAFKSYAGIMTIVYPVGIPLLYAVLLFQRRHVLTDADADKTIAQPIAALWEPYRPARFYYEVVECGRRVMLTGVVVFIFPNSAAQIAITMLAAFFFLVIVETLSPYKSESDMWLSRGGHTIVFLSVFVVLLLKVDVSGESDQSQVVFAGVLLAGHVLMILAIVVEVVGICFVFWKHRVSGKAVSSESLPGLRSRAGSSERPVWSRAGSSERPVFESAPASWQGSANEGVERTGSEEAGDIEPTLEASNLVIAGDEWEVLAEELQADEVYLSVDGGVRLEVQRGSLCGPGPGPIKLHLSTQLLISNGRNYITDTIVHCPANVSFKDPLLLDFLLDDPAVMNRKAVMQHVLKNYQVLRKSENDTGWESMEEEDMDLVHDRGATYLRAHIHHFTMFSCCRNCDVASGITYRKHSDDMAFYVENTTEKVLLLVTLPLKYSVVSDKRHAIDFSLGVSQPIGGGVKLGGRFERHDRTEYVSYPSSEAPSAQMAGPAAKKQRVGLRDKASAERLLICTIEDEPSSSLDEPSSSLATPGSSSSTGQVAPDALIGSGADVFQIVRYYDNLTVSGGNGLALHQSRLDVGCQRLCRVHKGTTVLAHVAMALAGLSEGHKKYTNDAPPLPLIRSRWLPTSLFH
ncbi:unnamed protein product [Ectocarpus fasciculatus]